MTDRFVPDVELARRLVADQFPEWASLDVRPVELDGVDNRTFRLGDELSVRLPAGAWYAQQVSKEQRWLPRLAPALPLPIPIPVRRGEPALGYPYPWSVYRWLEGEPLAVAGVEDEVALGRDVASFLRALAACDATGGPGPGEHNWFRGGPLSYYAQETVDAIAALGDEVDGDACERCWEAATAAAFDGEPVWFHGDVAVGNLLVHDGRLAAVIDFGTSGVGDPACDTVFAWTFLSGAARDAFAAARGGDDGLWARGRGWALWKALISLVGDLERGETGAENRRIVADVCAR